MTTLVRELSARVERDREAGMEERRVGKGAKSIAGNSGGKARIRKREGESARNESSV